MTERWAPCLGLEQFEASDLGRVRSVAREVVRRDGVRFWMRGKVLKSRPNEWGHLRVRAGAKLRLVHVLVAEAFIGARPPGHYCCHNDGNPANNRLDNLRWALPKENVADRIRHGTYQYGERNPNARFTDQQVAAMRVDSRSLHEIAADYGIDAGYLHMIRIGRRRAANGRWTLRVENVS